MTTRERGAPARRALGWLLTACAALGWGALIHVNAGPAAWPRVELTPWFQRAAWLAPAAILAGALLAARRRPDLLPYGGVLVLLWLPHAPLLDRPRVSWDRYPDRVVETIAAAQRTFRESDTDGDGVLDYGSLTELATARLLPEGYATPLLEDEGRLRPYRYELALHPTEGEFRWCVIGNPISLDPGSSELRQALAFGADAGGVFVGLAPLRLDPTTCQRPAGAVPFPEPAADVRALLAPRGVSANAFWRRRTPLGLPGSLAALVLTALGLGAWIARGGAARPSADPGEDDVAG